MVALLVSLCGALVIGVRTYGPGLVGRDSGVQLTPPGLLQIAPDASGLITLGDGRAVSLDTGGLTISDDGDTLFRTVRGGSPVTAVRGDVSGEGSDRREDLDRAVSNLQIERLVTTTPGEVRWTGVLVDGDERLPTIITVRYEDDVIALDVHVEGAAGVVVHSAQESVSNGLDPWLPERDLKRRAWWVHDDAPADDGVYRHGLSTDVTVGPAQVDRAVDLREVGHTDIHVWAPTAELTVTSERQGPGA